MKRVSILTSCLLVALALPAQAGLKLPIGNTGKNPSPTAAPSDNKGGAYVGHNYFVDREKMLDDWFAAAGDKSYGGLTKYFTQKLGKPGYKYDGANPMWFIRAYKDSDGTERCERFEIMIDGRSYDSNHKDAAPAKIDYARAQCNLADTWKAPVVLDFLN